MRYKTVSHPNLTETLSSVPFTNGISDEHLPLSIVQRITDLGVSLIAYPEEATHCMNCDVLRKEIEDLKATKKLKKV